ncbi:hypothetical protein O1R50_06650 [Glycomyces luteolus]|uniref:Outer membrane channel protein CpnT-like N-terminal domain-containing protein n=1 Tax=Glycomyces luteolus TaxID=2670330 RepID=A0A9X3SPF4_9ACTN|nr:hypothetical protein [Glycomyces luteolus]MDA1359292.1 hypothetical protein [Glycomyces luteolus]
MSDNPLVADVKDSHHFWKGAGIGEDIADIVDAIKSESWVDASLAGVGAGLSAVGFLDPLGAIVSTGVSWLIELIEPLRDLLDDLTGDADILTAHAQTWTNMAEELMAIKDELTGFIDADIAGWQDDAANAYKGNMGHNVEGTSGLAQLCAAMSAATTGAGTLVTITRELVRDLIAQLVATLLIRLPVWLGLCATGVGIPAVAVQAAGMIAQVLATVIGIVIALVQSLQALQQLLDS